MQDASTAKKEMLSDEQMDVLINGLYELQKAGQLDVVEHGYRGILAMDPGNTRASYLLGLVAQKRGNLDEAESFVREAVAGNPLLPQFHKSLADILQARGRNEEAKVEYRRALHLDPHYAEAHIRLGHLLLDLKENDPAAREFKAVLKEDKTNVEACLGFGDVCAKTEQFDIAEKIYQLVLKMEPKSVPALAGIGNVQHQRKEYAAAEATFRAVLQIEPQNGGVENNLGSALKEQGRIVEAKEHFDRARVLSPTDAEPLFNLGCCFWTEGDTDTAIRHYNEAIAVNPQHVRTHANLSMIYLLTGDFGHGWDEYEWRFKAADPKRPIDNRVFPGPQWDGSPFPGKTVFVRAEQGAGDMIHFCRFLPMVKRLGGKVILECQDRMIRLFRSLEGYDEIVDWSVMPEVPFEYHISLMSLPRFFSRSLRAIPATIPYLRAEAAVVEATRKLVDGGGFKVGLCWQGNKDYTGDRERSFPLTMLQPLQQIPGVRLFSLQKGYGAEQLTDLPSGKNIVDLAAKIDLGADWFVEMAAVMQHLDLVISCDTSVAHLAGALGRPVWLLIPMPGEWRWLLNRSDSPWYPSMRIFRQTVQGDWPRVITQVEEALRRIVSERKAADGVTVTSHSFTAE